MSFFEKAMKSVVQSLGEPVIFKGDGGLTESVRAVFSDEFSMLDMETAQRVTNNQPHIFIQLSTLSRALVLGDIFEIRSSNYTVGHLEEDGEGGARIFLRETS